MVTEQQIQKQISKYLTSIGAYTFVTISTNRSGVPDIIACHNGVFYGIEVKKPNTVHTTTPIQQYNIDAIIQSGGTAFVATSVEDVKRFLEPNTDEV